MPSMLVFLLGLAFCTSARIVGDSVALLTGSDNFTDCLTSKNGLITTTTTAFTSKYFNHGSTPLSWTLGVRLKHSPPSHPDDTITVTRDFYLGYPTNSSSSLYTSFYSCSILVHGATGLIDTSNLPDTKIDWGRELPSDCVRKLTTRVDEEARKTPIRNDQDLLAFCEKVGTDLSTAYPNPCPGFEVNYAHWKAFTSDLSQPGNCSSRSGGNYNFRWMDNNEISGSNTGDIAIKGMAQGTTPIIAVLFPSSGSNMSEPETHYLALKAEKDLLPQVDESSAPKVSPAYFIMLSWVVGMVFSILEYSGV